MPPRKPATRSHTPVTAGLVDALAGPTGALPAGRRRPWPQHGPRRAAVVSPLVVVRPGIGRWVCDACRATGCGWCEVEQHHARTGHRVYTPRARS